MNAQHWATCPATLHTASEELSQRQTSKTRAVQKNKNSTQINRQEIFEKVRCTILTRIKIEHLFFGNLQSANSAQTLWKQSWTRAESIPALEISSDGLNDPVLGQNVRTRPGAFKHMDWTSPACDFSFDCVYKRTASVMKTSHSLTLSELRSWKS